MLAMVLHGMQGTPYIYRGEEIGMTNPHFTRITDYRDVESLNMFAELRNDGRDADELLAILASKSRDNSRTPMQWSNGDNAGFTAGEPWIGTGDNYQQINVEAALADESSVFYTYQKLIALRKQEAILTWGNYGICCQTALYCGAIAVNGRGKPCWSLPTLAVRSNPAAVANARQLAACDA